MAAGPRVEGGQDVPHDEPGPGDLLHDELGDPVAAGMVTGTAGSVLSRFTHTSPRYTASIVPGALTTVTPWLWASPERGCTKPAQPSGRARATPVRTS